MLLSWVVTHCQIAHPDPPNQAGFTKESQCNDHIITLMSTIEKYKKVKSKKYAIFIQDMYSKSEGHIKMNNKISEVFKILKGTEQGHLLVAPSFSKLTLKIFDLLNEATAHCPTSQHLL